jgi:hypothetical protein
MAEDERTLMERNTGQVDDGADEVEEAVDRKPDGNGCGWVCGWTVERGELREGRVRALDDDSKTIFESEGRAEEGMRSANLTPISLSDDNDAGDCEREVRVNRTSALPEASVTGARS